MIKKIYIAGPMTGIKNFNYDNFNAAAAILRAQGRAVENPAENETPPCGTWLGYMRSAIKQLVMCDEVVTLPGHYKSRGARVEVALAVMLGIKVHLTCSELAHLRPVFTDEEQE